MRLALENGVVGHLIMRYTDEKQTVLRLGFVIVDDSKRGLGYGKEMLRLMLIKCKEHGNDKVLLTCDKENIASAKTTIANGAILENEVKDNCKISWSGVIQRYWIEL